MSRRVGALFPVVLPPPGACTVGIVQESLSPLLFFGAKSFSFFPWASISSSRT